MRYQVRKISSRDLSPIAHAFFEFAFPGFFYTPGSEKSLEKHLDKGGLDIEFFRKNEIPITFAKRFNRRYAGDVFGYEKGFTEQDLPRQRYGSLISPGGTDCIVLMGELLAYAGMAKTSILLADSFDHNKYATLGLEPGANEIIAILEQDAFTDRFARFLENRQIDLRSGGITLTDTGWILIHLQCRIEEIELSKVMDLRDNSSREAFYNLYYHGVPGFMKWPACHGKRFPDMLPHLYFQSLGGSVVHEAIGAHLRLNGYDGLIYPSARSDCSVVMKSGVLTDFHGFNLVVYKDAPIPAAPKTLLQVTYCPWSQIMPCDNFKIIVGDTPDSEGSLYVRGIWEMANKNLREKGYYYDTDPSSWPSLDVISVG